MNYIKKHLVSIIAIAIIIIGLLVVANLIRYGYLTVDSLVAHKDLIDVIGNTFTIFLVVIGAIVSYFRFFRGRIFSNSANIDIDVSVHKINDGFLLHAINVHIKNDGTFPIWEPQPTLVAYHHGLSALGNAVEIAFWEPELEQSKENIKVVNVLESEQFCAFHYVPTNIAVLTYVAQIKSRDNVKWFRTLTVSNQITKAG